MKNKRLERNVIVIHPAQQHSYILAESVMNSGRLEEYSTSIYYNKNKWIYKVLSIFLSKNNKERMIKRKNDKLEKYKNTYAEIFGLIFLGLSRVINNQGLLNIYKNFYTKLFNNLLISSINRNEDEKKILISFDTYSYDLIKCSNQQSIINVIDMSSVPLRTIKNNLLTNKACCDEERICMNNTLSKYKLKDFVKADYEIKNADYILVASNYTKKEILKLGFPEKKIYKLQYPISEFYKDKPPLIFKKNKNKIVFLFAGRLTAAKGFYIAMEAMKKLNDLDFECLIVGKKYNNERYINDLPDNFKYLGVVRKDEMKNIYRKCDVLVSPSMFDGYGFTILEALSQNLAVICSKYVGLSEIIVNEVNGFVLEKNDKDTLTKLLTKFVKNIELLNKMKLNINEKNYGISKEKYFNDTKLFLENINE